MNISSIKLLPRWIYLSRIGFMFVVSLTLSLSSTPRDRTLPLFWVIPRHLRHLHSTSTLPLLLALRHSPLSPLVSHPHSSMEYLREAISGILRTIFFRDGLGTSSSPQITTLSCSNGINESLTLATNGMWTGSTEANMTIPLRTASRSLSLTSMSSSVPLDIPT